MYLNKLRDEKKKKDIFLDVKLFVFLEKDAFYTIETFRDVAFKEITY